MCEFWGKSNPYRSLREHMLDVASVAEARGCTDARVLWLIAMHDIGKAHPAWQRQLPDRPPHNVVTMAWLRRWLAGKRSQVVAVADAVAGHHGSPVDRERLKRIPKEEPPEDFVREIADHFGLSLPVDVTGIDAWWLAGELPLCDWLASAALTPAAAGLVPVPPRAEPIVLKATPRPMQVWAAGCGLPDGPATIVIEDATGSGKTEAALILAHRLIRAGRATGIHVAMPTMATASAMYRRLADYRLFDGTPSIAIAHAQARHARDGAVHCAEWIAAEHRRVFFAQLGSATVDQSILAVLASRYNTLRLAGLRDKVLILDEAHAYDAYVSTDRGAGGLPLRDGRHADHSIGDASGRDEGTPDGLRGRC